MNDHPPPEDLRALISPGLVLLAACEGAFPMCLSGESFGLPASAEGSVMGSPIHWFIADPRAVLPATGLHVSRSLAKTIRQGRYQIRFDTSYERVMRSCLRPEGNWISEDIIRVYTRLFELGWGHCVEAWNGDELVGGVYGFAIGGFFSAESMFHSKTDAGKVALWALVERCKEQGFTLVDVQYLTPHLQTLGAYEMSFEDYQELLTQAIAQPTDWGPAFAESLAYLR